MAKQSILFLCTGNSARSQMAEGLLRHHAGDQFEVFSAGLEPKGVNRFAIQAMDEIGIDIRGQWSKSTKEYMGRMAFNYVIPVCANADESCPRALWTTPGTKKMHWPFEDPAAVEGTDEAKLAAFREVRDQIEAKVKAWLGELEAQQAMLEQPIDSTAPEFIKLLAHDLRWQLLKILTISDQRVQELVALVGEPMNLVSYHLKKLRADGVVSMRRSEADGRDVYYSLDMDKLRDLYQAAGAALHPAIGEEGSLPVSQLPILKRVLFVCTHNSARSQMAEGLMRHMTGQQIEVHSAGSHPTQLHPDAIATMDALGIDIRGQQSKHLHEFEGQTFDYVITVCDRAREICPVFPGDGAQIHWGYADPTQIEDAGERRRAFERTAQQLKSRIEYFLTTLPTNESEI